MAAILIVEDQMLIAWHLQDLVEQAGHRVTALARTPAEAISAAGQQRPDFVLMDIRLDGGTSGLEAARVLYERWGVRSIFLSANLDPETRSRAGHFRPLGFIGKPFLPSELIAALSHAARETAAREGHRANG